MRSKRCKYQYLDQQFYWAFYRYAVEKVWANKGGLRSSTMVIHAIKFYKIVLVREWYTSSLPEEYEYSRVLFCHDRSLGSIDSKESAKLKACGAYIECREHQRLVQFLTALRSDFKGLRGLILHRFPLPSVDSVVSELLAEVTTQELWIVNLLYCFFMWLND